MGHTVPRDLGILTLGNSDVPAVKLIVLIAGALLLVWSWG